VSDVEGGEALPLKHHFGKKRPKGCHRVEDGCFRHIRQHISSQTGLAVGSPTTLSHTVTGCVQRVFALKLPNDALNTVAPWGRVVGLSSARSPGCVSSDAC
jgi:hypothetical protein